MWQPIETAPKDGSFILLATPKGRIADGFWSPVYGVWSWPYVMVEPTHWMPLPELPGAQSALEESAVQTAARIMNIELIRECDALRAKVAEMEKRVPAALVKWQVGGLAVHIIGDVKAGDILYALPGVDPAPSVHDGWKEAAIAWEVCASIHREYGKGKDPFFNTRQGDFVKHANDARAMLAAAPEAKP